MFSCWMICCGFCIFLRVVCVWLDRLSWVIWFMILSSILLMCSNRVCCGWIVCCWMCSWGWKVCSGRLICCVSGWLRMMRLVSGLSLFRCWFRLMILIVWWFLCWLS